MKKLVRSILGALCPLLAVPGAVRAAAAPPPTMADVLAASRPADWRPVDPENELYLELSSGRVVIELAPAFAPEHVANIKKLVRAKYFDGLAFLRSQDNYVVQWGDPDADNRAEGGPGAKARPIAPAREKLPAEFTRPAAGLAFTRLSDSDGYAPEAGFSGGFPAARDPKTGAALAAHCYGMVGVGRGDEPESGNGAEIYVVIGNAPRHLDRNVALVGRVLRGMELLSTIPRRVRRSRLLREGGIEGADSLDPGRRRPARREPRGPGGLPDRHARVRGARGVTAQPEGELVRVFGGLRRALQCSDPGSLRADFRRIDSPLTAR